MGLYFRHFPTFRRLLQPCIQITRRGVCKSVQKLNPSDKWDQFSGMELTYFGTSSGCPTSSRNVTSAGLRTDDGSAWLFDCGEGTQRQIQRSRLSYGRIDNIFITHLHGDHIFGLPGLLLAMATASSAQTNTINIYGPVGIASYVISSLKLSLSHLDMTLHIHELDGTESNESRQHSSLKTMREQLLSHTIKGCSLHVHRIPQTTVPTSWNSEAPPNAWCWKLCSTDTAEVYAAPLAHSVFSLGYVIREQDQPGHLDAQGLTAAGVKPGPAYKQLKAGLNIRTREGKLIRAQDYLSPTIPGRKITILGDTFSPSLAMKLLAMNSDLLSHESTFTAECQKEAVLKGHSTSEMAARFAQAIQANTLVLTHFSARYMSNEPVSKMIPEARLHFNGRVEVANDLDSFSIYKFDPIKHVQQ